MKNTSTIFLKLLPLTLILLLDLFQQAILESGTALTCFDGALGYDGLSYTAANVLCGYTLDEWYSGNYTALKACMMNLTIDEINTNWMSNELVHINTFLID